MVDQEVLESQLHADKFPFPSEGEVTLTVGTQTTRLDW